MSEEYMPLKGLLASLFGGQADVGTSGDGKATLVKGEIASGVPITAVIRPSDSTGSAVDVDIDGNRIKHVTDKPKFP